jgi:AraC-like DNA-binding protein
MTPQLPVIFSDATTTWEPDTTWLLDAAVVAVVVMSGEAEISSTAPPLRMTSCTATFLHTPPAITIRLRAATTLIWKLPQGNAIGSQLQLLLELDEVAAAVIHDVFFENNRSEEHQIAALELVRHQVGNLQRNAGTLGPRADLVTRATAYMQSHLDDAITLGVLAAEFGCSKGHLTKCFQAERGESPGRTLAQLRMTHARQLLQNTELTVSQIARATGYKDLAAFSHFFKQRAGHAPSEFRDNCRWLI